MQTFIRAGERGLSLEEISDRWEERFDSPYSRRTFNNHREAVEEVFGVRIGCNRSTNRYFVEYSEDVSDENAETAWLINTFTVNNMLALGKERLSGRVSVEDIPSGHSHLTAVLEAMTEGLEIVITYQKYTSSQGGQYTLRPYAVKEFAKRWYIIGYCLEREALRVYGLDRKWTDLLWEYRNGNTGTAADSIIDDEFLRYFKFVCDIICYKGGESPQGKSSDEFDLLNMYFAAEHESVRENVETLERFFDCWCNIPGYDTPTEFLQSFISESYTHEAGKIIISGKPDIFEECLHGNADKAGNISQFPLGSKVRLYAIIIYLQNCDRVTRQEFVRRIRIIENLVWNSEDEVSDRSDRNRIPAILAQVDSIMLTGRIDDSIRNTFNVHQMREEKNKIVFVHEHPEKADHSQRNTVSGHQRQIHIKVFD